MKKFVAVMQAEHVVLKNLITEIVQSGPCSAEGKQKLLLAEELLLNHLEREESIFYPLLYEVAEYNPRAKAIMDRLHGQVVNLSMDFLMFFQQLHSGQEEGVLKNIFNDLVQLLSLRIDEEENHLLNLYRELEEQNKVPSM